MTLSLFSYPTTLVCVDDDSLFLASIKQLLKNTKVNVFNSAGQCIDFFHQYEPFLQKINFMRGCTEVDSYETLNHMPVDLNVKALKELYSDNKRNEEVAVLITDYNMPGMNGIDLCRELRALPMKKILLTGAADYQQAVAAFNEGLIDCFIQKDSQTLAEDVFFHLKRLSKEYFVERCKFLLNYLETDYSLPLSDPIFIAFFEKWCKENEIQEYYLIDKNGNFLLVDKTGKKSYFIVHTDRTLNNFIDSHEDDLESTIFISSVKSREKIPFFGEGIESWELQPEKWINCFYSSQVLIGQQNYYWTIAN